MNDSGEKDLTEFIDTKGGSLDHLPLREDKLISDELRELISEHPLLKMILAKLRKQQG